LSVFSPSIDAGLIEGGRISPQPTARARGSDAHADATRSSHRSLDWFSFFLADIQAGFGPFVAIYLTAHSWTQLDIGLVLTASGLVALAGQLPAGALVDAVRSARLVAGVALLAICASALTMAVWPMFPVVLSARAIHAAASCVLGPAIAVISLSLVGHAGLGERIGRNARFGSIGAGVSAAAMGACGYWLSDRSILFLTAILVIPALIALARVRTPNAELVNSELINTELMEPTAQRAEDTSGVPARQLFRNRQLLIFAACIALFQLANAAMLPLMGGILTMHANSWAAIIVAACVVIPQLVVVGMAPWVGRQAQSFGRRPLMLLCFGALIVRAFLFALVIDPFAVVAIQVLDGISAAIIGVMFPLVVADITRDTGRYSLALGIVGSAVGVGAASSTILAGYLFDHFGRGPAFFSLAGVAAVGAMLVLVLMPETYPRRRQPSLDDVKTQ
jgi:MFS family permease